MNEDNDKDVNEMSPMKVACIQLHEMYLELQAAGFTKREALKMVTSLLLSGSTTDE